MGIFDLWGPKALMYVVPGALIYGTQGSMENSDLYGRFLNSVM